MTIFGKFLIANVIDVFPVGSNTPTLKPTPFSGKISINLGAAWNMASVFAEQTKILLADAQREIESLTQSSLGQQKGDYNY